MVLVGLVDSSTSGQVASSEERPLPQPPEEVLKIEGLTKSFDRKTNAVDNVSFTVFQGEIFGFLGPNGAGKSTTINMLTTILRPTTGRATVCGHDLIREQTAVRRSIGVVPQESTADEDLTGIENVLLCADFYGIGRSISKPRAQELLELVELSKEAERKVITYSGGMKRRLELACGLINRPRLLFLDEPTLGLDVQTRAAVWDYIRRLKDEFRMTLFMTTHYLDEADNLCDRIALIDHGKILRVGSPSELKASLGGDIIEVEVQSDPSDLSQAIATIPNVVEVRKSDSDYRIKTKLGEETAPAIMDALRLAGARVTKISISKPSLDQVYLEYTGRSIREEHAEAGSATPRKGMMGMRRRR
ncbi:MAG TPA: ATP-binding cassette domain-containing protein [Nitrososphaerales archaeon]|nr:ATP-binding cassette domain-containing protein [Nitrososphaerales archaeon]